MIGSPEPCVFAERGLRCVWFECLTCGWRSHSADFEWSRHASRAHRWLAPEHVTVRVRRPHFARLAHEVPEDAVADDEAEDREDEERGSDSTTEDNVSSFHRNSP